MVNRLNRRNMTLLIHQFGAIALGIMAIALPACSSNDEVENGGSTNCCH